MEIIFLLLIVFEHLVAASWAVNTTMTCELGWMKYRSSCFMAVPMKQTWTNAKAICGTTTFHRGHLAELETLDKKHFLEKSLAGTYEKAFANDMFWLGGTDEGSEGHWRWDSSNSPLTYQEWLNHTVPINNRTDCLALGALTLNKFKGMICSAQNNFICEARATPSDDQAQPGSLQHPPNSPVVG